ncbi:ABC transporter permease [Bacteroidales bacterium OttesenSCG-928-C19]|nr:ABC transporter permease [Bacteroidales bacterium OttesenSCG-928-C19]
MLKQNKFISTISITGTAIAIMMVMVIIVTDEIKQVSVAPEINRDKTVYINSQSLGLHVDEDTYHTSVGPIHYEYYHNYLSKLETPVLSTAMNNKTKWNANISDKTIITASVTKCDTNYWKLMDFSFVSGKPFSTTDFNAGLKRAVISEQFSRKLFGNEPAFGRDFYLNYDTYKVVGVVKDFSPILEYAFADIWIPYSAVDNFQKNENILFANPPSYFILFLLENKSDFSIFAEEVRELEKKYNSISEELHISFNGPYDHRTQTLANTRFYTELNILRKRYILIFVILLIIPAVNLLGFSMSRIKRRTEEIGIRKAFGANKKTILIQVLFENFITSLIGGLIGLVLSYFIIFGMKEWLLNAPPESAIPVQALISFPIFLSVFLVCIVLNLLSAGIPAYKTTRINIVDSLNQNIYSL